jgi:2-polyprenyl-3-methyl-5-hydroxy-6-metoxy-1,4-benzoquinol methylase
MNEVQLTDRQMREREYYNTYLKHEAPDEVPSEPVLGQRKRSWNSYWYVAELAVQHFKSNKRHLLDFGCGPGYTAVQYAKIGYQVTGFDISPNNIEHAKQLASKYNFEDRTSFSVGLAEVLDFPNESFDIVIGVDILHHVDIGKAIPQCLRVLRPRGVAIFHEPIRIPVFDTLRESRFGTWLVPNSLSFERHITEDEKKLTAGDLELIKSFDPTMDLRSFLLFSRLEKFFRGQQEVLEKFDHFLFKWLPFSQRFGGRIVLSLHK